jgi:hypothetical protein
MALFSPEGGSYKTPGQYKTVKTTSQVPIVTGPTQGQYYAGGNTGITPGQSYDGGQSYVGNPMGSRYTGSTSYMNPQQQQAPTQQYRTVTEKKRKFVPGERREVAGIGQDFYDSFRNSILDYYQPEVARQFEEAQDANLYDLARRGVLRSSNAADNAATLAREKLLADADVSSRAENQTAGLRGDMARAQQNALSLLQATEDPTVAANAAATEVNAIQSQAPQFNPLGDLFSAAARSYAGYQQNQRNQRAYQQALSGTNPWAGSGRTII